ncbi:HET-domain-containing protein, partial [Ophiobolus disseminans]
MRLLNSTTMEFKVFNDEELPLYAILSHTWGDEEISYQDQRFIQRLAALPDSLRQNEAYVAALEAAAGLEFTMMGRRSIYDRAGYTKIEMTAKIAKGLNMNWFWVDTCCIDKSSSAELQEAINSMYRWYEKSAYCIVFLEDAEPDIIGSPTEIKLEKMLEHSRWIIRGWTLQELIAPHDVIFYDSAWTFIGEKSRSLSCIRGVTGIPEYVLATGDLSRASVAQKMAWAARRTTSRIEDIAYSLLGIFQVYMPMLYGERENAFLRLQEEIIRTTPDDSIFAWTASEGSLSTYRGLFARSPREFRDSHLVSRGHGTFASSNMGLRIELVLRP